MQFLLSSVPLKTSLLDQQLRRFYLRLCLQLVEAFLCCLSREVGQHLEWHYQPLVISPRPLYNAHTDIHLCGVV